MEQRKRLESIEVYFLEYKEDIRGIITNYYCLSNYQATVLLCARIAEKLLQKVCKLMEKNVGESGLNNLINLLKDEIPKSTYNCLHILRVFSNSARHGGNDDEFTENDVSLSIEALLNIMTWYKKQFGTVEDEKVIESENTHGNILIWGDIGFHYINNLIKKISRIIACANLNFIHVKKSEDFIKLDLEEYRSIILINTEVTKLSANDAVRNEINEALFQYVKNGGRLIGTHDVVYNRTRNTKLQEAFGIKTNNYERKEKNIYIKTDVVKSNHMFEQLPEQFQLSDGEVCWGTYSPDILVLFENENKMPLVTFRNYEKGSCFWMMTGDKVDDCSPVAICKPEDNFIYMLCELLLCDTEMIN